MRLRHVLLLVTILGAGASLVLAANFYTQIKRAEHDLFERNAQPGADTILAFGSMHLIGLAALAVLFMALFLMLLSAIRDPKFVAKIEGTERPAVPEPPVAPAPAVAIPDLSPAGMAAAEALQIPAPPVSTPSEPPMPYVPSTPPMPPTPTEPAMPLAPETPAEHRAAEGVDAPPVDAAPAGQPQVETPAANGVETPGAPEPADAKANDSAPAPDSNAN